MRTPKGATIFGVHAITTLRLQMNACEVLTDTALRNASEPTASSTEPVVHVDGGNVATTLSFQRVLHVERLDAQERTRLDHGGLIDQGVVRYTGSKEIVVRLSGNQIAATEHSGQHNKCGGELHLFVSLWSSLEHTCVDRQRMLDITT
uniref:Uncharacterized protein n=1 Tax=Anopheles culicifacies TaxID=139723 RepID=A0A182M316_9DIPT